jgi:hypothetical protein
MKKTIKIEKIENKLTKANDPFIKVNGEYTIFDEDLIALIKKNEGKQLVVNVETKGQYKNIRTIFENEKPVGEKVLFCPTEVEMKVPVERPMIPVSAIEFDKKKAIVREEMTLIRDKPNARTFGVGKDQIKIYFDTPQELEAEIKALNALGLMPADYAQ